MKVLWITNIVFPEAQELLLGKGVLKASGGWMLGAADALLKHEEVDLYVSCPTRLVDDLCFLEGEKIKYYLFPMGKGNTRRNEKYQKYWRKISEEIHPDVVHIHGTEYSHGLEYVEACGANNVIVSIQGLVSVYARYYNGGLSRWEILRNFTLRDLVGDLICGSGKYSFERRGKYEIELLKGTKHIIGRTSWDRAHAWTINPDAEYHFCNETLRPEFYSGESWSYDRCHPHRVFVSQASYPIKGLHMLLRALPLVLQHFPDTTVHIAGSDITCTKTGMLGLLKLSGYGKIIRKIIHRYDLQRCVTFTGSLDANGMKQEYLQSNVFVCPSAIENSPNSLGEAQILGTPIIASYVGGIADMMKGDEEHLYRFEEVEMLANKICKVFRECGLNKEMMDVARRRHSADINSKSLIEVYNRLLH